MHIIQYYLLCGDIILYYGDRTYLRVNCQISNQILSFNKLSWKNWRQNGKVCNLLCNQLSNLVSEELSKSSPNTIVTSKLQYMMWIWQMEVHITVNGGCYRSIFNNYLFLNLYNIDRNEFYFLHDWAKLYINRNQTIDLLEKKLVKILSEEMFQ